MSQTCVHFIFTVPAIDKYYFVPQVHMYKSFGYVPRSVVTIESAYGLFDMTMLAREPKA
jgi:hypothetical protein